MLTSSVADIRSLWFGLILVCLSGSTVSAQFNIDGERWTSSALSQAQGYSQGDPLTLTWGFAAENIQINGFAGEPTAPNDIRSFMNGIYGNESVWLPLYTQVFDRWSSISGLSYQYEASDDGAAFGTSPGVAGVRADVRIGSHRIDGNGGTLAYNFYPNSGDMVLDSADNYYNNTGGNSLRLRNILAHEHGHGVGMAHLESNNSQQLMEPFINLNFDGPQYFDILSAHRGYGDFNEKSFGQLGNDTSTRATFLGDLSSGGSFAIGQSALSLSVDPTAIDFVSIDDQTDTDFYSFSLLQDGLLDLELSALGFTFNVGPQGGSQSPFNTRLRSDLALSLFDSSMSLIDSSNSAGLGGIESLTQLSLTAGDYFIRVTGVDNSDFNVFDVQFYGLTGSFTANAIPEPAAAQLLGLVGLALWSRRRRKSA